MARTKGPLMSLDASGSVASTLTFSKWKGRNYVRELVRPANPKSALQVAMRALVKYITQRWAGLGASDQATWVTKAKIKNITGLDQMVSDNAKRHRQSQGAIRKTPPAAPVTPLQPTALTATAGFKQITLAWVDSTTATAWAVYIYRKIAVAPSLILSELIAIVPRGVLGYTDTGLVSGTVYFYAARAEDESGSFATAAVPTASATPT